MTLNTLKTEPEVRRVNVRTERENGQTEAESVLERLNERKKCRETGDERERK